MTDQATVTLSRYEVRAIRRGLKRLSYETNKTIRRNDSKGWKPDEGRMDWNRVQIRLIESLLDRLPFPDYPDDNDPNQPELL